MTAPALLPSLHRGMAAALVFSGLCTAAPALWAASFLGVDVPPPLAAKNVVDTYWKTPVDDPYRFLENTQDPAVQTWMKAQADATDAILAKLPARTALLARIAEIDKAAPAAVSGVRRTASGRYFYMRRNPSDNQFKLVYRDTADGPDVVLVDPEVLARATGKPHAIGGFAPSPDGQRVAYSISSGGTEIGTLQVLDVNSGKELDRPIPAVRGGGDVSWLPDGKGFFYFRLKLDWASLPATERFQDRLCFLHLLGAEGEDPAVFGPGVHADVSVPRSAIGYVFPIAGTGLAASLLVDGVKREQSLYLADMADVLKGKARWRRVFGEEALVTGTTIAGGWVYVKTAAQAPRFRVLRMPLAKPDLANAELVVPAGDDVVVEAGAARDALYVTQRQGPLTRLLRVSHGADSTPIPVELPLQGGVDLMFTDPQQDGAVFRLSAWTRASTLHTVEPAKAGPGGASPVEKNGADKQTADAQRVAVRPLPLIATGLFDAPDGLLAREVRVKSHDGVEVPVSIISRANVRLDGNNPTLLYGYGAYGTTQTPGWSPRLLAWLERGGVFVIAHVRGGGVFGDAWHRAGQKTTKPNTWKDGIAVAEWLIAQRYTAPDRLAVMGGSAGGIFVGRVFTARPDLFAAAVVAVGNTDLVRSETRANGVGNIPEYGTVKKEDEFRALLEMSPYANTRAGEKYPAVLFEHGVNDSRVDVWMTLKTASRLAAATASGKPVLQRLEYNGGHGVGSTREQAQRHTADRWAFLLWQFGLDEPAP